MLQSGIKVMSSLSVHSNHPFQVEPLLMKDWSAVMDWSPNVDHKGEYLQLWNKFVHSSSIIDSIYIFSHNLDKAVAQSQSFINECRRALGLSMKFWVAEVETNNMSNT